MPSQENENKANKYGSTGLGMGTEFIINLTLPLLSGEDIAAEESARSLRAA